MVAIPLERSQALLGMENRTILKGRTDYYYLEQQRPKAKVTVEYHVWVAWLLTAVDLDPAE